VLAFVVALAVVAFGTRAAQGATDLAPAVSSTPTASTADTTAQVAATSSTSASTTSPTTVTDQNGDGVARVVVIGDSLVVGAEDELTAMFTAEGVDVRFIAVSGTGILTDQGVRLTELENAVAELHPDAVIIESCCNYDGNYVLPDGTVVPTDSQLLWDTWAAQARLMVAAAQSSGADVYAVLTPRPVSGTWFSGLADRIEHFNDIYRSLGVGLIDWDAALYPDGTTAGHESERQPDGLHLTTVGDALVTAATWAAVAPSFS